MFPLFKVSTSEPPPPSSVPVVLTIAIPLEDDTACSPPPPYEPTEDQDTARGTCLIFSSIIFWVFWYIQLFCCRGMIWSKAKLTNCCLHHQTPIFLHLMILRLSYQLMKRWKEWKGIRMVWWVTQALWYLTNRSQVVVHLFSNKSQRTSKPWWEPIRMRA